MNRINTAGHFFLSHTKLHGKFTIRIAIGNMRTTEQHILQLWGELQEALTQEMAK